MANGAGARATLGVNGWDVPPLPSALIDAIAGYGTFSFYNDGGQTRIRNDNYGGPNSHPVFELRKARGTLASPSAIQAGDEIGAFTMRGYGGTTWAGHSATILASAAETFTDSAQGVVIECYTCRLGHAESFLAWQIDGAGVFKPQAGLTVYGGLLSTFNTNIESGKSVRATGYTPPSTGAGVEMLYTGGAGKIVAIDRDASAHKDLNLTGLSVILNADGVETFRAKASGAKVTGTMEFTQVTAASAGNGTVFVDSADGKMKFKDSGGTVNALY